MGEETGQDTVAGIIELRPDGGLTLDGEDLTDAMIIRLATG